MTIRFSAVFLLFCAASIPSLSARADYSQRLSLGVGVATFQHPSQVQFEIGAEYEYRLDPTWGLGGFVNYIFTDPGTAYVGLPDFFLHPLGGEWLLSASPVVEFGELSGTRVGARFGTRIPVSLGAITLVPSAAVDVISGGPDYIFGLGIEF
jgi:hypothetical protein